MSGATSSSVANKHEEIWFEDGTLILQAEQTLFKVHRSLMSRHSDFFKDMLTLPPTSDDPSASAPLFLPDVSSDAFANLLRIVYCVWGTDLELNDEEYILVLQAAQRYQFPDVLAVSKRFLETRLPSARKLQLALKCSLDEWELPAFQSLVLAFDDPTPATDPVLDLATWNRVLRARHEICQRRIQTLSRQTKANEDDSTCVTICIHVLATLLLVLPSTPRARFKSAYDAAKRQAKRCPDRCATLEQNNLECWVPSPDEEAAAIAGIWAGDATKD